jgi:hypothetical protein
LGGAGTKRRAIDLLGRVFGLSGPAFAHHVARIGSARPPVVLVALRRVRITF